MNNEGYSAEAVIIELNKLKDESVVTGADERNAATDEAIMALRRRISVPLVTYKGWTVSGGGEEIVVRQPGCPICGTIILNAQQRHIKFCPECGQAIHTKTKIEERN